jgi:hypothetical protein
LDRVTVSHCPKGGVGELWNMRIDPVVRDDMQVID